jgi:hypothetical protein
MSAIFSLKLAHYGQDICQKCYRRDEVTKAKDENGQTITSCFECVVAIMNLEIEQKKFKPIKVMDRYPDFCLAQLGKRIGEVHLFERVIEKTPEQKNKYHKRGPND